MGQEAEFISCFNAGKQSVGSVGESLTGSLVRRLPSFVQE